MDSISQAVLGSAVCLVATRGKQPGKAVIAGALLATLPDLDSFLPSASHLSATVSHRTWSHSWIVHTIISPVIASILYRMDRSFSWLTWFVMTWATLVTHAALDCFTIYGTDIFWPFSKQTVVGGSIFIIDPLFTLPLLIAVVSGLSARWKNRAVVLAIAGLGLSSAYLAWGVYSQNTIEKMAISSLSQQNLTYNKLIATPTPFNSILWRVLAMDDNQYHEGFYSKFDRDNSIVFHSFPRKIESLDGLEDLTNWEMLDRFSHSYNALKISGDSLIGVDLRMGVEDYYFFQFYLAHIQQGNMIRAKPSHYSNQTLHSGFFTWLWKRLNSQIRHPFTA